MVPARVFVLSLIECYVFLSVLSCDFLVSSSSKAFQQENRNPLKWDTIVAAADGGAQRLRNGDGTEGPLKRAERASVFKKPRVMLAQRPKSPDTTTEPAPQSAEEEAAEEAQEGEYSESEASARDANDSGESEEDGEDEVSRSSESSARGQKKLGKDKPPPEKATSSSATRTSGSSKTLNKNTGSTKASGGNTTGPSDDRKAAGEHEKQRFAKKKPLLPVPFLKPKNESVCTPEAYLEFPKDPIGNRWRARGLVVIHIAVVCYMFYSLALVCERYFMPSLEEFAQRLNLSEDVAGATLMSAGSSAPELFTAILGVFVAKGDVGTGAIVGSAVFNILFVIGICSFVSTTCAQLNWWPVLRDSVFYTFTVLVLILFIYDERVTALESFLMLALYGVYILLMVNNEKAKAFVTSSLQQHPLTAKLIGSVPSMDGPDEVFGGPGGPGQPAYASSSFVSGSRKVEEDSMYLAACLVIVKHKRLFRSALRFRAAAWYIITKRQHRLQGQSGSITKGRSNEVNYFGPESEPLNSSQIGTSQRNKMDAYARTASKNKFSIVSKDDYEFWNRPPEGGERINSNLSLRASLLFNQDYYVWLMKIPVNYVLHYTIPDCTLYPNKYLITFFVSIIWTAVFSYLMVWMVTLIGYTFGIPDSVMGVTFLAAGTSVPDCYSSIHAARNGMADMAVSNSIGSNVFDILVGLSLPWFIQTAIYPGVVATINSRGVIYSVILLFLSLVVTIYLMNKYEWTLKPRLGLALLVAYGLFILLTSMLEFNLFGHVNPPPCPVI